MLEDISKNKIMQLVCTMHAWITRYIGSKSGLELSTHACNMRELPVHLVDSQDGQLCRHGNAVHAMQNMKLKTWMARGHVQEQNPAISVRNGHVGRAESWLEARPG